jgi:arylsulfatase A-like enzyme
MSLKLTRHDFLKLASFLSLISLPHAKGIINALSSIQSTQQKNILVFVFDALSARHMSLYGYARNTTPNLTRFAEQAFVYHSHHSGGNFTTPGVASLLTGVYPWSHRAIHTLGTTLDSYRDRNIFSIYPIDRFRFAYTHNPLAEMLLQQYYLNIDLFKRIREFALDDPQYSDRLFPSDYNVSYWSEQLILRNGGIRSSSLFGSILYRILHLLTLRKFQNFYGPQFPLGIPYVAIRAANLDEIYFLLEDAVNWLIDELPRVQKPFFGYFHIIPPHSPYFPRKDFIGKFHDNFRIISKPPSPFSDGKLDEELNNSCIRYDEYLAYADAEFGRLYDAIAHDDNLGNSIIVVTADHGELFERGIQGHTTPALYEPIIHIPLLISIPQQSRRQDIYSNTSCVDLLPTLAKLTNQPIPNWTEGQVLPGFTEDPTQVERNIFSVEAKSSPKFGALNKVSVALIKGNYKLIYYRGYPFTPAPELYDLANDPEEVDDLAIKEPSIVSDLQQEIEKQLRSTNSL